MCWVHREIKHFLPSFNQIHCDSQVNYAAFAFSKMLYMGREKMFYLTTHSTHFIYGYMASDIWLRTILIVRKETRCCHIGYSFRLTARVLLYAPSHRQDNTYHGLCYTSCGALAGTRSSSMGPPHEGSIRRSLAPWANALPLLMVQWVIRSILHGVDSLSYFSFQPVLVTKVMVCAILSVGWCI